MYVCLALNVLLKSTDLYRKHLKVTGKNRCSAHLIHIKKVKGRSGRDQCVLWLDLILTLGIASLLPLLFSESQVISYLHKGKLILVDLSDLIMPQDLGSLHISSQANLEH